MSARRHLVPRAAAALLALAAAACGGAGDDPPAADRPPAGGMDALGSDPTIVADTQRVVDSLGQEFLVISAGRPRVRAVIPRAGAADPDAPGAIETLTPVLAARRMGASPVPWYVLDVRSAERYVTDGRLSGAVLVPPERLEENLADLQVRTDQVLLVYDGGDGRAARAAARLLASHGFPVVRILEGGFPAWRAAGLPSEGGR